MSEKQILAVHPSVMLGVEARRKLAAAGYVVVIADPSMVRVIVPEFVGGTDSVTRAALLALKETSSEGARQLFGKHLASILTEKKP